MEDAVLRFGKERLALSIFNVNVFFKQKEDVEHHISELIVLDERLAGTMSNVTEIPYTLLMENAAPDGYAFVEIGDTLCLARWEGGPAAEGEQAALSAEPDRIFLFDPQTEQAITGL